MTNDKDLARLGDIIEAQKKLKTANMEALLERHGLVLRDPDGNFRNMGDVLLDLADRWETYSAAEKLTISDLVSGGDTLHRYHAAVNASAKKCCGVDDALTMEQTTAMLAEQVAKGGDAGVITARMCASAYGIKNVPLRDALLIADDDLRRGITRHIIVERQKRPTASAVLDILLKRWSTLDDDEKSIVSDFAVGEGAPTRGTDSAT